jgi:DNA-binding Lrp family transcriptional regulator
LETVYVLLKTEPGKLEEILKSLKKLEGVREAAPVTGAYDIIARIDGEFITDALGVVVKEIRKIPGIQGTETLISVKI